MMKSCLCYVSVIWRKKCQLRLTRWVQSYQNYTTIEWQPLCSIYVQIFFLFASNDDDALSVIWNLRNCQIKKPLQGRSTESDLSYTYPDDTRWAVATGNSWSVHFKHTGSLIATFLRRPPKEMPHWHEQSVSWSCTEFEVWMIKKTATTSSVWFLYHRPSPAELPPNSFLHSWCDQLTIIKLDLIHCHFHWIKKNCIMFLTFGNSGVLNRSQFWILINFSKRLQDIQLVGLDKLIVAKITVAYTQDYDIENKQALLVELLAESFKKRTTRTIIPNKRVLW